MLAFVLYKSLLSFIQELIKLTRTIFLFLVKLVFIKGSETPTIKIINN